MWREYRGLAIFVVLMAVFRSGVADWNTVPSGSMLPTIVEGDRILVDKLAYDIRLPFTHLSLVELGHPQRGDIVVFDSDRAGLRMVKRVVGLPGDVVAMRDNRLYVNGAAASYRPSGASAAEFSQWVEDLGGHRHLVRLTPGASNVSSFGPVQVPEGHYLVLGDNRDNSADSRVYGYVPRETIVGRSRQVAISLDYDKFYLPRGDRFLRNIR